MKVKKIELEVDFIGGEGGLTVAEEKALSDFFKQRKNHNKVKTVKTSVRSRQVRVRAETV
jgi:hypothetical protein